MSNKVSGQVLSKPSGAMGEERKLFTGWPRMAGPGPSVRRRSIKHLGAEAERTGKYSQRVLEGPVRLLTHGLVS